MGRTLVPTRLQRTPLFLPLPGVQSPIGREPLVVLMGPESTRSRVQLIITCTCTPTGRVRVCHLPHLAEVQPAYHTHSR